mgnify:FL=1
MTGLSEKPIRYKLPVWIQIVDDDISIALMTGSKDNNLKVFT